jgi:hypothetical protein
MDVGHHTQGRTVHIHRDHRRPDGRASSRSVARAWDLEENLGIRSGLGSTDAISPISPIRVSAGWSGDPASQNSTSHCCCHYGCDSHRRDWTWSSGDRVLAQEMDGGRGHRWNSEDSRRAIHSSTSSV